MITDRHAAWFLTDGTKGIMKLTLDSLISWSRDWGHSEYSKQFPGLRQLPFLLTEALLNHGFDVKDIEEFKTPV